MIDLLKTACLNHLLYFYTFYLVLFTWTCLRVMSLTGLFYELSPYAIGAGLVIISFIPSFALISADAFTWGRTFIIHGVMWIIIYFLAMWILVALEGTFHLGLTILFIALIPAIPVSVGMGTFVGFLLDKLPVFSVARHLLGTGVVIGVHLAIFIVMLGFKLRDPQSQFIFKSAPGRTFFGVACQYMRRPGISFWGEIPKLPNSALLAMMAAGYNVRSELSDRVREDGAVREELLAVMHTAELQETVVQILSCAIDDQRVTAAFVQAVESVNPEDALLRRYVLEGMDRFRAHKEDSPFRAPRFRERVAQILFETRDPETRRAAAKVLWQIGEDYAAQTYSKLLRNPDESERLKDLAILLMRNAEMTPSIIEAHWDCVASAGGDARREAIERLARAPRETERLAPLLTEIINNDVDDSDSAFFDKLAAVRALGYMAYSDPKYLPILVEHFHDAEGELKKKIAEKLVGLDYESPELTEYIGKR